MCTLCPCRPCVHIHSMAMAWGPLIYGSCGSGTLPASWATSNLSVISLKYCSLHGTLPAEWGSMPRLKSLLLEGNQVSSRFVIVFGAQHITCQPPVAAVHDLCSAAGRHPAGVGHRRRLPSA